MRNDVTELLSKRDYILFWSSCQRDPHNTTLWTRGLFYFLFIYFFRLTFRYTQGLLFICTYSYIHHFYDTFAIRFVSLLLLFIYFFFLFHPTALPRIFSFAFATLMDTQFLKRKIIKFAVVKQSFVLLAVFQKKKKIIYTYLSIYIHISIALSTLKKFSFYRLYKF